MLAIILNCLSSSKQPRTGLQEWNGKQISSEPLILCTGARTAAAAWRYGRQSGAEAATEFRCRKADVADLLHHLRSWCSNERR